MKIQNFNKISTFLCLSLTDYMPNNAGVFVAGFILYPKANLIFLNNLTLISSFAFNKSARGYIHQKMISPLILYNKNCVVIT